MNPTTITCGRYTYVHDVNKGPPEAIDVHHITVLHSGGGVLMFCTYALIFVMACLLSFVIWQDKFVAVLSSFTLAGFLLRSSCRKQVEKESVIIFPSFGIQLEIVYRSGRTVRRFVPIGKILKAVLNECVTPVTCYWNLSLILHGEKELLLVFKELYPPVSMLVPVWTALCSAIDGEECNSKGSYSDISDAPPPNRN